MIASEIKELSDQELKERLEDYKGVLTKMKLNHAVSPLDNPNKIGETRKDIARLNTELKARQIKENK